MARNWEDGTRIQVVHLRLLRFLYRKVIESELCMSQVVGTRRSDLFFLVSLRLFKNQPFTRAHSHYQGRPGAGG